MKKPTEQELSKLRQVIEKWYKKGEVKYVDIEYIIHRLERWFPKELGSEHYTLKTTKLSHVAV